MRIIKAAPQVLLEGDRTEFLTRRADSFREFFAIEASKDEVYQAYFESIDNLHDLVAQFLAEAGPIEFSGDDDYGREDMVDTPRKPHLFGHDLNTYLKNIPAKYHSQAIANRYSKDTEKSRYTGDGLMGALAAVHRGEKVGNWTAEIRWTKSGNSQKQNTNIIDPETKQRIPLMGAHTRRPIKDGQVNPNPPKKDAHTPAHIGETDPEKYPVTDPSRAHYGGWHAGNGVYTGYGSHVLNALGTDNGHPRDLKPWNATGPGAQLGRATTLGKPSPLSVGKIGADLSAPVPDDKETGGYTTGPTPGAAGYRISTGKDSSSIQRNMDKWVAAPYFDPNIYDRRALNAKVKSGQVKTRVAPLTGHEPLRDDQGNVRKRQRIQNPLNPTDPKDKILEPLPSKLYTDDDLKEKAAMYAKRSEEAESPLAKKLFAKFADQFQQELAHRESERTNPRDRNDPTLPVGYNPRGIGRTVPDMQNLGRGGNLRQWDPDPRTHTTTGSGPEIMEPDPENPGKQRGTGMYHSRTIPVTTKGPDGSEQKIPTDYHGPVTADRKLDSVYKLYPAPGEPITISKRLKAQWMGASKDGEAVDNKALNVNEGDGDDVFLRYNPSSRFMVKDDGTFYATDSKGAARTQVYRWAKVDKTGDVLFIYVKDEDSQSMPFYSPGKLDDRNQGKATVRGGILAHPPNSAEHIGYKDKARHESAMENWGETMHAEARKGVLDGIEEIKRKGASEGMINNIGSVSEFVNSSVLYLGHNLRNPKALDDKEGHDVHFDFDYIHQHFIHLYAAIKQMDNWMGKNADGKKVGMKSPDSNAARLGIPLPFSRMSIVQVYDTLEHLADNEGDNTLFRTKVHANKLHGNLPRFQNTVSKSGKPIPATGTVFKNSNGEEIPVHATAGYSDLNVNWETMFYMMDEARRYYFRMAAKDMVVKEWQSKYRQDKNMITGAREIVQRGEKLKGAVGHHIHTNLQHQINAPKRSEYNRAREALIETHKVHKANPQDMDARTNYTAAKRTFNTVNNYVAQLDAAEKKIRDKMARKEITSDEMHQQLIDLQKEYITKAENADREGTAIGQDEFTDRPELAHISPEQALHDIATKHNVDASPTLTAIGNKLGNGDEKAFAATVSAIEGDHGKASETDAIIRYHAIKTLLSEIGSMTSGKKAKIRAIIRKLHDRALLVDFTEQAEKLVGSDEMPHNAAPSVKTGIGRARKKTG